MIRHDLLEDVSKAGGLGDQVGCAKPKFLLPLVCHVGIEICCYQGLLVSFLLEG